MYYIVTNSTQRQQIPLVILPALGVMLYVMNLKMTSIRRIPFVMRPTALRAFIPVPAHHCAAHIVWNGSVMLRVLPIGLKDIHAYVKIGTSCCPCDNGSSEFSPKLANTPCPFGLVARDISQFFVCDVLANIRTDEFQNLVAD